MDKKLAAYVALKVKEKALKDEIEKLGAEIKDDVRWSVQVGEWMLSKREKVTYKIKEWIDIWYIEEKFPIVIKKEIIAKELYRLSDSPTDFVDKNITEYLAVTKAKDDATVIDF